MVSRAVLPDNSPLFGIGICYPNPGAVERIGADWDWLWIDAQHGELGYQDVLALVRTCDLVNRPVFVRVASHDYGEIGRALDTGAAGVVVPCVDTAEQARRVIGAAKFPPIGARSYGSRRVVDLRGRMYSQTANDDVKLIMQIETPLAIENAAEIAALPGVDALFLGPDDLLLRRGVAPDVPRTRELLGPDLERVAQACKTHGKDAVTVAGSVEIAAFAAQCGYRLIAVGSDVGLLANASSKAAADFRSKVRRP